MAKITLPRTVCQGNSPPVWNTIMRPRPGTEAGSPPMVTLPEPGSSSPASSRSSVLLPQPDLPTTERNSPPWTEKLTCSSAFTSPAGPG